MSAVVFIAIAVFLGLGLVMSQLARLRKWLAKPPLEESRDNTRRWRLVARFGA